MAVSHEHLNNVQVWDGKGFSMMDSKSAQDLVRRNKVQITKDLQSKDLKTPEEFAKDEDAETKTKAKIKNRKMGKYQHREMKAENE